MYNRYKTECEVFKIACNKIVQALSYLTQKKIAHLFNENSQEKIDNVFYRYIETAFNTGNPKYAFSQLDNVLLHLHGFLKRLDLSDQNKQDFVFFQLLDSLNVIYGELISKNFGKSFNTISKNRIDIVKDDSIGKQLENILYDKKEIFGNGLSCRHRTTLLIQLLEQLKYDGLNISNILFLERTGNLNHSGIIVLYRGTKYLIDSSGFNHKLMQPLENISNKNRWELGSYIDSNGNIIFSSIDDIEKYSKSNRDFDKLFFDCYDKFLETINDLPQESGVFISRQYTTNLIKRVLGIYVSTLNDGILLWNNIFFQFDNVVVENIDLISDEELVNYIVSNVNCIKIISQPKTFVLPMIGYEHFNGGLSEFDKKLLTKYLLEMVKRSDIQQFRASIKNPNNRIQINS